MVEVGVGVERERFCSKCGGKGKIGKKVGDVTCELRSNAIHWAT